MFVCLCAGITLEQIKKLQKQEVSVEELRDQTGAGDDCGTCLKALQRALKQEHLD